MQNSELRKAPVTLKIFRPLWIGVTAFVLLTTLYAFDGKPESDIGIFFAWYMLFLSFPVGMLVPLIHVGLDELFSIIVQQSYLSIALDWAGFVILGYLQWFILMPYLVATLRSRGRPKGS